MSVMKRTDFLSSLIAVTGAQAVTQTRNKRSTRIRSGLKALVLSGGIAKGVYEAGVLEGLMETGEPSYDVICGTSIGALNGAMFALGKTAELRDLWHNISRDNVLKLRDIVASDSLSARTPLARYTKAMLNAATMHGFFDTSSIKAILKQYIPDPTLKIPIIIGATNISERKGVAFYRNGSGKAMNWPGLSRVITAYEAEDAFFRDVLLASASVPGAFPSVPIPVVDHGRCQVDPVPQFVDGGIANNTPIKFANAVGATRIDVVFLDNVDESLSSYPNTIALGFEMWGVMQRRMIADDARSTYYLSRLQANGSKAQINLLGQLKRTVGLQTEGAITLRQIRPRQDLPVSAFGFDDQDAINSTYHIGLLDGRKGFQDFNISDLD